jgi:hypothetical protein
MRADWAKSFGVRALMYVGIIPNRPNVDVFRYVRANFFRALRMVIENYSK